VFSTGWNKSRIIFFVVALVAGGCVLTCSSAAQAGTINTSLVTADQWKAVTSNALDGGVYTLESPSFAFAAAEAKLAMGSLIELNYAVDLPEYSIATANLYNRTTGSSIYLFDIRTDDFTLALDQKVSRALVPQDGNYLLQFWIRSNAYAPKAMWVQAWFPTKSVPEPSTVTLAIAGLAAAILFYAICLRKDGE
jgi:hypothetical protein